MTQSTPNSSRAKATVPLRKRLVAHKWLLEYSIPIAVVAAMAIAVPYLRTQYDATFGIPADTFTPLCTSLASLFGLLIAVTAALTAFVVQSGFNAWYTNIASLQRLRDSLKHSTAINELSDYPQTPHLIEQLLTISQPPTGVLPSPLRRSTHEWRKGLDEVLAALKGVSAALRTKSSTFQAQLDDLKSAQGDVDLRPLAASGAALLRQSDALQELIDQVYAIANARIALTGVERHMKTARGLAFSLAVAAVSLAFTLTDLVVLNLLIPGGTTSNHTRFDVATLILGSFILALFALANTLRTHLDTIREMHIPDVRESSVATDSDAPSK